MLWVIPEMNKSLVKSGEDRNYFFLPFAVIWNLSIKKKKEDQKR